MFKALSEYQQNSSSWILPKVNYRKSKIPHSPSFYSTYFCMTVSSLQSVCSHLSWYIQVRGNQPLLGRNRSSQHNVVCPRLHAGALTPRPGTLCALPESDCRTEGHFPQRRRHGIALSFTLGAVALALPARDSPGRSDWIRDRILSPPRMQTTF